MLRHDGTYKIYRIQHRYRKRGDWTFSGDSLFANVPPRLRFTGRTYGEHRSPFLEFGASGDVWQQTGIHGTYSYGVARRMLELVAQHNEKHSFRIVLILISQETRLTRDCHCEICRAELSIRVWKRLHEAGYRTFAEIRSALAQDHRALLKIPGFGRKSFNEFAEVAYQVEKEKQSAN